jgi:hypothetical protein
MIILCISLAFTGCNQPSNQKMKSQAASECKSIPIRDFAAEKKAKSTTEQVNGVDKAVAVMIDKELNVALEVTNFNRLRLEPIKKEVTQKLKTSFPKANIHVTTDSKLYDELQKLNEKPWTIKDKNAGCKQKDKLKQIEQQMGG